MQCTIGDIFQKKIEKIRNRQTFLKNLDNKIQKPNTISMKIANIEITENKPTLAYQGLRTSGW